MSYRYKKKKSVNVCTKKGSQYMYALKKEKRLIK